MSLDLVSLVGQRMRSYKMETNMNITSATQGTDELTGNPSSIQATIDGQLMSVPLDPSNRHYVEIMRQVEAGTLVVAEAE